LSGIVALVHLDDRPADATTLGKMAQTLSHRGPDGCRIWVSGATGLACQHFKVTPESTGELRPHSCPGGLAVGIDGRLDNRDNLIAMLAPELGHVSDPSDSALVLAAYRHFGEGFATHLNGDFALAIFDTDHRKLLLARDIIGVRTLYYWQSRQTFLAASEIKAILAHPEVQVAPDDDALADFILGGDPYQTHHTCFRNVYRVALGHTMVVERERIRSLQHWDFNPAKQVRHASIEDYAEALRALFEQAVRRRLRSMFPVAVLVSGGLDSSAVLCQAEKLRQAGAPVAPAVGVSMVFPKGTVADEEHYLDDIEATYKIRIGRLPFNCFQFEDAMLWHTEVPRLQWDSTIDLVDAARDMGSRVVLDGDYGDQTMFSDAHILELARSFRWFEVRRELAARARSMRDVEASNLNGYYREVILRDFVPDELMPAARSVRRMLGRDDYPGWYTKSFQRRAFKRNRVYRRPCRGIGGKQAEACYQFVALAHRLNCVEESNKMAAARGMVSAHPFLDRDLIEFMMAIPGEIAMWQGIAKGLFRESMRGVLPENIRTRNWKSDFTSLNNSSVAKDYARFQQLIQPDCLAVRYGYVDPKGLQRRFSKHKSALDINVATPARWVTATVGLELWLKLFFPAALDRN
jgi:asparagine synthase (glutamine-hydrolysing)